MYMYVLKPNLTFIIPFSFRHNFVLSSRRVDLSCVYKIFFETDSEKKIDRYVIIFNICMCLYFKFMQYIYILAQFNNMTDQTFQHLFPINHVPKADALAFNSVLELDISAALKEMRVSNILTFGSIVAGLVFEGN